MRRQILWGRVFALFGVIVALVGGIYVYRILGKFRGKDGSIGEVIGALRDPRGAFPNQKNLTILLIGQDYNHDKRDFISSKGTRADTIMLLSVDLDKKTMRACSVPRDMYVSAPDGKTGKINATYTRGGAKLLRETLEEKLAIKIDNYFMIKPDAVRNIVDSIGGVEVETLDAMNYDDNWGGLHIHLPAGKQLVDGKGAEGFVRFREVNRYRMTESGSIIPLPNVKHSKEEGDIRRMARQQQMIQALVHGANSPGNLVKADSIIETGFNQVETDLPRVKCLALANLFKGSSKSGLVSATLPGRDTKKNGVYFYELDEDRARDTVDYILKGDEAAGKRLIRIGVKNGTKVIGVAKALATQLESQGYTASSMGNATATPVSLIAYQRATHAEIAKQIQQMIGAPAVSKAAVFNPKDPDIEIVIGDDLASKIVPTKPKAHT